MFCFSDEDGEISATESETEQEHVSYQISTEMHFTNLRVAGIAFVKRGIVIEADKSISVQIRCMTLNEGSPYETLHSYVSSAVAPYFKSYIKETGKAER